MRLSDFVIPVVIAGILLYGLIKKVDIFDTFVDGAKEGLSVVKNIFPVLVGLLTAISMLQVSGAIDVICYALAPVAHCLGVPPEVMPLAILRPISGSGSLTICQQLLTQFSSDSYIGNVASVLQGSSETTFYAIAVYFGAVGISKIKYAIPAALIGDLTGLICSGIFVKIFLGC